MSKGIIKEKKPQKLSRLEVLKAWIAESIASIKRSLKDGGWKGTALGAATLTSAVGAGIVLVACVPTEVQIEKVTSESEVNRLVSANFSEEDAVRDEMTKQYGALSDFEYNNGKATANVEKDGKSYAVSAEIDLGASDFEVTKYTNAELSGNNLTYTSEGQDVSENVSDKIVVEENGVIYVIDPGEALNTISIAVSDAILTENVDPENPGGEDKPDPDEPENPGGEDKPDPDEPENPGGEENPDPENPGGEENPDPDKPTEITFDSWQELMSAGNGVVQDAVFDILQTNLLTESVIKNMFGNDMTTANLNDGTIEILKLAFDTNDSNEITAIEVMGTRTGFPTNANQVRLETASFNLQTPIALDSIGAGASNNDYSISYPDGEGEVTIDLSAIATGTINASFNTGFRHTVTDQNLNDTMKSYFDLCMPLAVEAGLIDADANIAFCFVQGRGGTNSEWGTTFNIAISFIEISTNQYYTLTFVFDDEQDKDTLLERLQSAIDRGNYRVTGGQENTVISGDQIFESEALDGIVKYTIPAENQK